MTSRKKKTRSKRRRSEKASGAPMARLPLPARGEKRHGDATKYSRPREKRRWREETRSPERGT